MLNVPPTSFSNWGFSHHVLDQRIAAGDGYED